MLTDAEGRARLSTRTFVTTSIAFIALLVLAISMVAHSGTPDPTDAAHPTLVTASVNSGVIVFREGLEAVLSSRPSPPASSALGASTGDR